MKHADMEVAAENAAAQTKERRYIYNGEPSDPRREDLPRGNRPVKKRKRSPFNIIVAMIIVSLLIVCYVWNKITVNQLAVEINDLQMQHQKIEYANEVLRAEVNRKSSLERISKIATEKMGMVYPRTPPTALGADDRQRERLEN